MVNNNENTKDSIIEWRRKYYMENREKIIERQKQYNKENIEKIKQRQASELYKAKNRETMRKYYHNIKANNPEKYQEIIEKSRIRCKVYRDKKRQERIDSGEVLRPRVIPEKQLTPEQKKERQRNYKKKYMESVINDPEKLKKYKECNNNRVKRHYNKKKEKSNQESNQESNIFL